ncbi:MAG: aminomethyl transferase family protein [Rhizobiales bacterium]|nr:aminomethyl transferase family protein [Hyphomicrobiales bacterium]
MNARPSDAAKAAKTGGRGPGPHTPAQLEFRTPRRRTPFHARTSELAVLNDWATWAGYTVVNVFRDLELEYTAIRNSAGLFDLSPMVTYRIEGDDAEAFLDRLTLRNVARLAPGRMHYTAWCDDDGKVMDDGTLMRLSQASFLLHCQERHLPWLLAGAEGFDVVVDDISDAICALSLQGPTSYAVLEAAGAGNASALKPFEHGRFSLTDAGEVTISRSGFTGDLGYEVWTEPARALALYDTLMAAGAAHGIMPFGNAALNIARIEAGFIVANQDFVTAEHAVRSGRPRSPFEIGLGWMVDFGKGHFNGRRALLEEKESESSKWCLVGLDIGGNKPAHQSLVYTERKVEVGHVTAATWSPATKRNIALASLRRPHGLNRREPLFVEIYVQYELEWKKLMEPARVVDRPFHAPARRWTSPPART